MSVMSMTVDCAHNNTTHMQYETKNIQNTPR